MSKIESSRDLYLICFSEPEAAAVHCAYLTDLHKLRPNQNFMICDAGKFSCFSICMIPALTERRTLFPGGGTVVSFCSYTRRRGVLPIPNVPPLRIWLFTK